MAGCFDCARLGAKVGRWYRCHGYPDLPGGPYRYQRFPQSYHSPPDKPCPDFEPKQ